MRITGSAIADGVDGSSGGAGLICKKVRSRILYGRVVTPLPRHLSRIFTYGGSWIEIS